MKNIDKKWPELILTNNGLIEFIYSAYNLEQGAEKE